jgi:hypothetical protein
VTLARDEDDYGTWERRGDGRLIQSSPETHNEPEPLAVSLTDYELQELTRDEYRMDDLYEMERLNTIRE